MLSKCGRGSRSDGLTRLVAGAVVALAALAYAATARLGVGRRFWVPVYRALVGGQTHQDVVASLGPRYRADLRAAAESRGLGYPPGQLTLVGLKAERVLEVWARSSGEWVLYRTYPVLAASGGPGPKLLEGDRQVPEGIYRLTAFNPNSSYHLSVRVDYPNRADLEAANADGRTNLGGDIFIHGKAVSIGCLAIGDEPIEELYLLLADVGLSNSQVVLTPSADPVAPADVPAWVSERYDLVRTVLEEVRSAVQE